jgi:hypothetical protein
LKNIAYRGRGWRYAAFLPLIAALLVFGAVACGDDDNDEQDENTIVATATSPAAANTPAATSPTARPSASPAATTTGGSGATAGRLSDLNSYRYTLKMEGMGGPLTQLTDVVPGATPGSNTVLDISGTYIKPDKAVLSIQAGSFAITQTMIGNQQWVAIGSLVQGPSPLTGQTAGDLSFAALFWDESFVPAAGDFSCSGSRETVNGISTRKCEIDRATFDRLRNLAGGNSFASVEAGIKDVSSMSFEAWMADAGYPVRLRVDMAGKDTSDRDFRLKVDMDITDINSSSLTVTPPS